MRSLFIATGGFDIETLDPIYERSQSICHFAAVNQSDEKIEKKKEVERQLSRKHTSARKKLMETMFSRLKLRGTRRRQLCNFVVPV